MAVSLITTFACLVPGQEICTSLRADVESRGTKSRVNASPMRIERKDCRLTIIGARKVHPLEWLALLSALLWWTADIEESAQAAPDLPYSQIPFFQRDSDQSPPIGAEVDSRHRMSMRLQDVQPRCRLEIVHYQCTFVRADGEFLCRRIEVDS